MIYPRTRKAGRLHINQNLSLLFFSVLLRSSPGFSIAFELHTAFCLVHCRYQYSWIWSDETLGIYLFIDSTGNMSPPYCAMMQGGSDHTLSVVTCDQKVNGSFLCELEDTLADDGVREPVQFPTLSSWTLQPMMAKCHHNHTTHTFLACDQKTNCSAVDLASSISCATHRFSPAIPFFTCRNEVERVPFTLVCDHRSDCCDSSDEDFCQFPACLKRKEFACKNKKQVIFFSSFLL